MFTVSYKPSTSHWIFPPIIMWILAILFVIMMILRITRCRKTGTPFFGFLRGRFFVEHWDKARLVGTVALFVLYILFMDIIGFLAASIIFVFLYNVLYAGIGQLREIPTALKSGAPLQNAAFRSIVVSLVVSVVFSTAIWFLFGQVFKITLP